VGVSSEIPFGLLSSLIGILFELFSSSSLLWSDISIVLLGPLSINGGVFVEVTPIEEISSHEEIPSLSSNSNGVYVESSSSLPVKSYRFSG